MHNKTSIGIALLALCLIGSFLLRAPRDSQRISLNIGHGDLFEGPVVAVQPQEPVEEQRDATSVQGTVVDEENSPLHGISMELIPSDKTDSQRWYGTKREWTDQDGKYRFNAVDAGEYLVAALKHGAPDGSHPFTGVYYRDSDDEAEADHVLVTDGSTVALPPLRLRHLETATVKVKVAFADGTIPAWSNLLFHNVSYPEQAVMGDEAPGLEYGRGEITLPEGFEYDAQAKVDCDAGPRIESRESQPVQRIKIEDGYIPQELTFTIPGLACKLWTPN